tara:strand:- start:360 stop:857 length:498 start_codon:yes stop_codon:yes gene_type:complete
MFPFGHLIGGWGLGKLFEVFSGTDLTRTAWIILLFGSLLPDSDFIIDWIFKKKTHRTFTHSIFFIFFIFVIGFFVLDIVNLGNEAIFISLGVLSHIFLDMISNTGVVLFWPYKSWFSFFGVNRKFKQKEITIKRLKNKFNFLLFDSVLGLIWLSYLYFAGKIILS